MFTVLVQIKKTQYIATTVDKNHCFFKFKEQTRSDLKEEENNVK